MYWTTLAYRSADSVLLASARKLCIFRCAPACRLSGQSHRFESHLYLFVPPQLHVSDWSESQKQKLSIAHEKAHELLAAVEAGTKWNLTQAYDIQKLMRVCGLEMTVRELYRPEDKPQFMDIIALKKTLQELKQHRNKTRIVSFTGM